MVKKKHYTTQYLLEKEAFFVVVGNTVILQDLQKQRSCRGALHKITPLPPTLKCFVCLQVVLFSVHFITCFIMHTLLNNLYILKSVCTLTWFTYFD